MLIRLDFGGDVPIYQQLRNQMVVAIAAGQLAPGERLPTVRDLAEELGVNMMTVSKAYRLLRQEGYITTDRRSGAGWPCAPAADRRRRRWRACGCGCASCGWRGWTGRRSWPCAPGSMTRRCK